MIACATSVFVTALGQVMLYVDGMNGVINHNETIQWLYSLLASRVSLHSDHPSYNVRGVPTVMEKRGR